MNIRESMEDYLETILILSEKGDVRSKDVVSYTGFSKPSVSIAMKKLKEKGLIVVSDSGLLSLTKDGREIAEKTYERHRVISAALMKIGVPEEIALEDACKIEHEISDETFEIIKAHVHAHK